MTLGMILKFDKINVRYIRRYNNRPLMVVRVFCRGAQISCAMSAGRVQFCALAPNFCGSTLFMLNLIICLASGMLIWLLDLFIPDSLKYVHSCKYCEHIG